MKKWIGCCSAVLTLLCLSASANAGDLGLFGGGKACGPSCPPHGCQPLCEEACKPIPCMKSPWCKPPCHPPAPECCRPPVCLSTCYKPPTPVCVCPPSKCCPPEVIIKSCACCPPLILPPPPCHKPIAPPTICCCEIEPHWDGCYGGCGTVPIAPAPALEEMPEPEEVPEPSARARTIYQKAAYKINGSAPRRLQTAN